MTLRETRVEITAERKAELLAVLRRADPVLADRKETEAIFAKHKIEVRPESERRTAGKVMDVFDRHLGKPPEERAQCRRDLRDGTARTLRIVSGWTPRDAAYACDIPELRYLAYETGRAAPTDSEVDEIYGMLAVLRKK